MHRHVIRIIMLAAVVASTVLAWDAVAGRASAPPTVVGTMDLPRVLESLDEWKAEMARSAAAGESFQAELIKSRDNLDALAADLDDFVVGTEQYAEAEHALKKASIDLRAFMSLADLREARTKQRAILRIYNHIREGSAAVSQQEGYGIVLMDDSAIAIPEDSADILGDISARRVLYASPTLDVTDAIIQHLNSQWQAAYGQ
ncbi:MAG: OmpH family outer membrane protein [Phycisphaerales bacterium]|nr:OmpH family outer membrane protein [Phycisphaerales bacterium]